MHTEYISRKTNLFFFESNPITIHNLPREILEIILSNVPTNDSNHNLPGMRLISKEINHVIIYSKNEKIQKVFENIFHNKFKKDMDIEEIKKIMSFCESHNCCHRSLSIAYLQASKKIKSLKSKNFIYDISTKIYSTNLLNYSLWNNEEKEVVFTHACKLGHIKIIKDFIEQKFVDPATKDNEAIQIASHKGHKEIVELLLNYEKVDPSVNYNHAIKWASYNGHKEVVELLLKQEKVDPSDCGNFAIRWASQNGSKKVVELLLKDGRVDPSAEDNEAIRMASYNGHKEVVELLLKDGRVDPSADNNFAIYWALFSGYKKVVELLLKDERVDPSINEMKQLKLLSQKIVTILVEWAKNNPHRKGSTESMSLISR